MAYNNLALNKILDINPAAHAATPSPGFFVYDAGADALATVVAAGYFNADRKAFKGGTAATDLILAVCSDGFRILRVTAPASGNVTVAAILGAVS